MRIINGILFVIFLALSIIWWLSQRREDKSLPKCILWIKKHIGVIILLFVTNMVSFYLTFVNDSGDIVIEKEGYNGNEKQIGLLLEKENTTEMVTLNVRPRRLTKDQQEQKMQEAFAYIDGHLRGQNDTLLRVTKDLEFSLDYEKYPFDVEFQTEDYALIDGEGRVKNKREELMALGYGQRELETGITTQVKVVLWYGEESRQQIYEMVVFPREESSLQEQFSEVKEQINNKESRALYEEQFILPANINGVQLTRTDENHVSSFHVLVIGIIIAGLLLLREREAAKNQEKKREEMLKRSFPWFVNELALLLGAGMQVKNIFAMLIEEYERNREGQRMKQRDYREVLIGELKYARQSLALGISEEQVYYQLGRRLKLPCYIKLMTLLEQNVKRGTMGLTAIFEQEELNALEERKNLARRYGEEAGTKLLGPMILLLIVIMLMIMIPAFLSFS